MNRRLCMFFVLVVIAAPSVVMGGDLALTFTDGNPNFTQMDWMAGWRFDVNDDILVDGLGFWDSNDDGLNESHEVGIWTDAGDLVTSGVVPSGTAAPLDQGFRIQPISPVMLTAGTRYRIAAYLSSTNNDGVITASANSSTIPEITYLDRAFLDGPGGFTFPSGFNQAALDANFGPSFTVVPEPSMAWMAATLLCCSGRLRRR